MPTLYDAAWIFTVYAFLGWCTEVVFQAASHGKFINRGFLNGPVCPIYGFGVLIVLAVLMPLKDNFFALFFGSVVLTSALEFITGFILERFFHDKWWDYSKEPFNIKGYICLRFSLAWGVACVVVVDTIHPMIMYIVGVLPVELGTVLVSVFIGVMTADAVVSVAGTIEMCKRMRRMNEIAERLHSMSDKIGESLAGSAIGVKDKLEENKGELEELKAKYKMLAEKKSFTQNRLMRSFPHLETGNFKASIEKKAYQLQTEARGMLEKQREAAVEKDSLKTAAPLVLYRKTLSAVVEMLEARDPYTARHSARVAEMSGRFARVLGLNAAQADMVEATAAIHDIGKIGVSDEVLKKSGQLNDEDWAEIKTHPNIGADIVEKIGGLDNVAAGIRHHHERWDGGGYPAGALGTEIPLCSRIIAVCGSVDAMMNDRAYRSALSEEECRAELEKNSGKMYQPELVEKFIGNWDKITGGLFGPETVAAGKSRALTPEK